MYLKFLMTKSEELLALGEEGQMYKVTTLRDTGAALTLSYGKALPNVTKNLSGEKVVVKDLTGISSIPLANIYLDCLLVKGKVELRVIDKELTAEGFALLIGNDLAEKLIVPYLIVSDIPMNDMNDEKVDTDQALMNYINDKKVDTNQAPTYIVTRSQAGGTTPIWQHPYREEVDYLLRARLAKPSKSSWATPCLLLLKEDGSMRQCTDYRRVNSVTVKDSYPLPRQMTS
ncbi:uncharacterized protein LOC135199656 [Macrobrachium nipponense]|uniref:uncharacterized protein LOC135199656 n=1 Tax=Macrobrachium nipponense TaxID=159736 RepID=UPI0030C7B48B